MKKRSDSEHPYDTLNFGEILYLHMYHQNISKTELAHDTGLCRDIIRKYIKNETTPSLEVAWKLSKQLGFSLDALYYRRENRMDYRDNYPHTTKWDRASFRNAQPTSQAELAKQQRMKRHWNKFKETFIKHIQYASYENTQYENTPLMLLRELIAIYIKHQLARFKISSHSKEELIFAKIKLCLVQRGCTDDSKLLDELRDIFYTLDYAKDEEMLDGMMDSIQKGTEALCATLSFTLQHILVNAYAPIYAGGNFISEEQLREYFPDDLWNEPINK